MNKLRSYCQDWLSNVWNGWKGFWFTPANPTTLGILRLLAGGMLVYSHIVWGLGLDLLLGPNGWHSADAVHSLQRDQYAWSFWWLVPTTAMYLVHWFCLALLICFFVGLFTPVTGFLAFVISASYMYRAPMANYGMDQFLSCLLFYLVLSPCGKTWSVDWLIARYRAAKHALRNGETQFVFSVAPSVRANLFQRLIQVQLCIVYFFAGTAKLQGTSWWTGMAMWQAFSNLEYQSIDMTWLAFYPILLNVITHVTILWEIAFPFLVWNRYAQPLILLMGILMHLGIGAMMGMWTFGLIMIFGYLAFCSGETMSRLLASFNWRLVSRPQVSFDPALTRSIRRAAWFKVWDFQNSIELVRAEPSVPNTAPSATASHKTNTAPRPGTSLADMDVGGLFGSPS